MARVRDKLNGKKVPGMREPGLYSDGDGLYLRIDQTGSRRWVFIYHHAGKRREMGLGSLDTVNLKDARAAAEKVRADRAAGLDPIEERRKAAAPAPDTTFAAVAGDLMDGLEKGWKSPKQRPQWEASLKQHAAAIWKAEISAVDTEMVLKALREVWTDKPDTARRVRSRIEMVLDAAAVRGLREGDNPARWRGHLARMLPKVKKAKGHHPAMDYGDVPGFLTRLEGRDSISADALRFLILTAVRSGEVRGATWEEIRGNLWIIPAERMKASREHRVPLSKQAMAVLDGIDPAVRQGLIFPGLKGPLSDMALAMVMRKLDVADATPHGFRSSFRDWAGDCTNYPRELLEEALAHQVGSAVERAYRRGTALEKRRDLMNAWGDHCTGVTASNIHQLRA